MTDQRQEEKRDGMVDVAAVLGDMYEAAKTAFNMFESFRVAGFTEQQALYLTSKVLTATVSASQVTE